MKKSMGIENTTLVREARNARRAAAGAAAFAWPPEAAAAADAMTISCFGQITRTTLKNMTVPNRAPVRIVMAQGVDHAPDPSGDSPKRFPRIASPVRNVTIAPPRNHHGKHHQAYITNLNNALAKHPELSSKSLEELLRGIHTVPEDIRTAVRNNAGGHHNHSLFWTIMAPAGNGGGGEPSGKLADAITETFGEFTKFKEQ